MAIRCSRVSLTEEANRKKRKCKSPLTQPNPRQGMTGFSGGMRKEMKLENCHCEGAAVPMLFDRGGNLLPPAPREQFIFLRGLWETP